MKARSGNSAVLLWLLVGLAVLIAIGIYFSLEWEEVEISDGYSDDARTNDFLAAEQYLNAQGIETERRYGFSTLDRLSTDALNDGDRVGAQDTLIIVDARGILSGTRFENLWRWLESGGHLIVTGKNPFLGDAAADDELFAALDVSRFDLDDDGWQDQVRAAASDNEESADDSSDTRDRELADDADCGRYAPTTITLADGTEISAELNRDYAFLFGTGEPVWRAASQGLDRDLAWSLSYAAGDGNATFLSSLALWENRHIECHDHAYLLQASVNPDGRVLFLLNTDAPSLLALTYRHLPYLVYAGILFVLLTVWFALTRWGPITASASGDRRRFVEHIYANSALVWRFGRYLELLGPLRRQVEQRVSRRHVDSRRLSQRERSEFIAKRVPDVTADQVEISLYSDDIDSLKRFLNITLTLKKIKDAL